MCDVGARRVIGAKLTRIGAVVRVGSPRPAVLAVEHRHAVGVPVPRRALNSQTSQTIQRAQIDLQVRLIVIVRRHPETYSITTPYKIFHVYGKRERIPEW